MVNPGILLNPTPLIFSKFPQPNNIFNPAHLYLTDMYHPPIKQICVLIFTQIIKENREQYIQLIVQFQKHTFSSSLLHPLLIFIQLLIVKYL